MAGIHTQIPVDMRQGMAGEHPPLEINKIPSIDRVMDELSKIVPPDPTPTAKAQALEAAAQAARTWYKYQALRPDDCLPVDYVCRQIGNAIMALANRP